MNPIQATRHLVLKPENHERLAKLCGQFDENLHLIERHLGVEISTRGNEFQILGIPSSIEIAYQTLEDLYQETAKSDISHQQIMLSLKECGFSPQPAPVKPKGDTKVSIHKNIIKPRTANQQHYLNAINHFTINFGIGPSGTGKTYLAVACALAALETEQINRIVLVRPAVEAGESLGFLPGDLSQKIDPYLRPLYDALYEMLGMERVHQLLAKGTIEIAPLAYMRGRTLNDSFIILDEGQNATREQMKMFLTRIGFGSKAVITGDITQTDLPRKIESGLRHAIQLLQEVDDVEFTFFKSNDIVRHPVVQKIIEAYETETVE